MSDIKLNWKLDDLLKEEEFDATYEKVKNEINALQKSFDKLTPEISEKDFKKFTNKFQKTLEDLEKLSAFASLYSATNISSQKTLYYSSKSNDLGLLFSNVALNIKHWLLGKEVGNKKKLSSKKAKQLFASMPELKFYFETLEEEKKHTLSLETEQIVSQKNGILKGSIMKLFGLITNDFTYTLKAPGKKPKKIKTQGELLANIRSNDSNIRKAAYNALFEPYKKNISKIFTIYSAIVKDWDNTARVEHFEKPISLRNFYNNIEDKTVDTVMDVCTDKRVIFQDYFKLKAKVMGIKKLSRFDLYAPINKKKTSKTYTFKEAKEKVLDNFKQFNDKFYKYAKMILDNEHVDSHPRENKRSGAFCLSLHKNIVPYVLLNFNGNVDALMTMAHELGHGIHGVYSWKQPTLVYNPPLPLAETASTFSEMLMFDRLLNETNDKNEKITMLFEKLDSSFATILRQNYFVKFEILAHDLISKGTDAEKLSDLYMETLKEQFGTSIKIPSVFKYEWTYIPHIFHTPFYCYAYNFGQLLSMSLFNIYKEKGKSFIPKIEKVLSAGGSEKPERLLKSIGLDITDKKFWENSFKIIEEWLIMLDNLL